MRALNVFLAFATSLLIAFVLFEGGLRLFPNFRPQPVLNQFDDQLGWSKTPGKSITRSTSEFSVEFDINQLGLRDDPMTSTSKEPGTFRVLMLGDSFVLGYTVDRDQLFVDHLERWWGEEGRKVDVVNAGTEGYSTDQEVLWFLEKGVDYQPDLVCIFPYENDIYWAGELEYHGGKAKPRFRADGTIETGTLADNSPRTPALMKLAFGQFLMKTLGGVLPSPKGPGPHEFVPAGQSGEPVAISREFAPLMNETPDFLEDSLAHTKGALIALQKGCKELGARLVMVPIPSESAIHEDALEHFASWSVGMKGLDRSLWSPDRPVDTFLEMAQELGIEAYDPRPALKARTADTGNPLYFEQEWHFNPEGNHAFALALHKAANNRNWFPQSHEATGTTYLMPPDTGGGLPSWVFVYAALWLVLGISFCMHYRDENPALAFLKVGALLSFVFLMIIGGGNLIEVLPSSIADYVLPVLLLVLFGFIAYKLGRRLGTILELMKAFTLRGHWYLMPLVVVLLTIGSLLVVAASSPIIAPFIYTLF